MLISGRWELSEDTHPAATSVWHCPTLNENGHVMERRWLSGRREHRGESGAKLGPSLAASDYGDFVELLWPTWETRRKWLRAR